MQLAYSLISRLTEGTNKHYIFRSTFILCRTLIDGGKVEDVGSLTRKKFLL
jgi:hypothetical protein